MGARAAVHPTDQTLQSYGLGTLDVASAESVSKHLELCSDCQSRLAEMSSDSFLGRLRDAGVKPGAPVTAPVVSSLAGLSMLDAGATAAAPPAAETLPPGLAEHPDYEVVRELGQGGMGTVYLAKNRLMGRYEVLKVVSSHLIKRRGVLDRFLGEIRNAARLHHTNIVMAYSASRLGESIIFAMEYVEGLDLAKLVKAKGALPVANACNYIHQAALGLQAAHEQGMVHRDIKPSNLMLARQGSRAVVKVLDFGLAKIKSEGAVDSGLTHEGQMLGTPDYISPEQISDARRADIRADIYSLGCTLYYLLAGRPPFQANSLYDLLQAHHSMDATPLNLPRPEVPVELAALVAKMMAKEPERRFQSPKDVAKALKAFFKPGTAAAVEAAPEISQIRPPDARLGRSSAEPELTRPPRERAPTPARPARDAEEPTPRGSILEALAELDETEPLFDTVLDRTPPKAARKPSRQVRGTSSTAAAMLGYIGPRAWWAAPGVILLGLLVAWAAVPGVRNSKGKIELADLPKDAKVNDDGVESPRTVVNNARPEPGPLVKTASSPASINNSIGMTLKLIPAGEFMMGSPEEEDALEDQRPEHRVRITRPFYLGAHEVTQAQYKAVMGNNPSYFSVNGGRKDMLAGRSTDQYPVETVAWLDTVEFCNSLSEKEGLKPFYEVVDQTARVPDWTEPGYRLPTEAEWEYACRANTKTPDSIGAAPLDTDEQVWHDGNSGGESHPVGQKRPNAFGLFDMRGNVWEWCWDEYDGRYYQVAPADDPRGPIEITPPRRVIRGGSGVRTTEAWISTLRNAQSTNRSRCRPEGRTNYLGFRVVRGEITERSPIIPASISKTRPTAPQGQR